MQHIWGIGEVLYRGLMGKSDGKRQLGRSKRSWEDNMKVDLQEVGWGAWTGLVCSG